MTRWHPISEAPVRDLLNEGPFRCLVYGPDIGVKMGSVWRHSEDSSSGASADSFCGDWNITHFADIPSPPNSQE
jgi:hypothetical protein